ncbi:MAG: hypothetical protein IT473_11840 [Lysobacter sp.]|nr:hypothetical protein [Lysobacter sp.]
MNRILDLQKIDGMETMAAEQRSGISFLCSSLSLFNCAKDETPSAPTPRA